MAYDGSLLFNTRIDESGFVSGTKKLGKAAVSGLKMAAGAVTAVTGVMAAGVTAGVKYNASMENYFSNFETMLGSVSAATEHVAELKEFAAKTPFEMNDLADASKTLLAFGVDVADISGTLQMLGDVSLGNQEKFSSLALVFGQVQSQGKLMGQDLLQMINAGFNPLQIISEQTGESMSSLKDKMSKGQITAEMVADAFKLATSEGGKFAGGMEKASKTFDGVVSTLKDNAMSLLGEVVEPITESMTNDLLPAAIEAVDELTEAFREHGVDGLIDAGSEIIGNVVSGIASGAPAVVESALEFTQKLVEAINQNLPTILNAGIRILLMLIDGLLQMTPSLVNTALQIMKTLAAGLSSHMGEITQTAILIIIQLAWGLIQALPYVTEAAISLILGFIQGILQMVAQVIEAGWEIVKEFAQSIKNSLSKVYEAGQEATKKIEEGINSRIQKVYEAGRNLVDRIKSAFDIDWGSVGRNLVQGIADGISSGLNWIKDAAKKAAQAAYDAARNLLDIHSPSRKSRYGIGRPYAQGIAIGTEEEMEQHGIPKIKGSIKASYDELRQLISSMFSGTDFAGGYDMTHRAGGGGSAETKEYTPIDYDRLADAVADALEGMGIKFDDIEVGRMVREVLA